MRLVRNSSTALEWHFITFFW